VVNKGSVVSSGDVATMDIIRSRLKEDKDGAQ